MATSNKLMQEIYDQFLICKICYETYKRPKTLACLHIFCTECLEHHMEAEMERYNRYLLYSRTITCPICRKKTELPTGGVRRLADNFLVSNLTTVLSKRKQATDLPLCGICLPTGMLNPQSREAVSKCLDCFKLLCASCVELHRRTKVTQTHSLIDIEDEKDIECKIHQDEVVRFYCEPCEMCICVVCTFQEHKGHEVASFTEGMHKYRRSMDEVMVACKDRVSLLRNRLELITRCETAIHQAEERIRDTAIESISSIRKREKQMLEDLRVAYGEETMEYIEQKSTIQEALDNLVSTCNLTDIMLKDKGVELLLLKKDIQDKLQEFVAVEEIPPPENIAKNVKFRPGSMVFGSLNFDDPKGDGEEECSSMPLVNGCESMDSFDFVKRHERATSTSDIVHVSRITPVRSSVIGACEQASYSFVRDDVTYVDSSTSPTQVICFDMGINTWAPLAYDSYTMTDSIEIDQQKVQTEMVSMFDSFTEMPHIDHVHKHTNTALLEPCDRSTLTIQTVSDDKSTDTRGLIFKNHRRVGTPVVEITHSTTLTDKPIVTNKVTSTDPPELADKITGTPRLVFKDEETCTAHHIYLDMGVDPEYFGVDKASSTVTVVTTEASAGDHVASTANAQTSTIWKSGLCSQDKGTVYEPPIQTVQDQWTMYESMDVVSKDQGTIYEPPGFGGYVPYETSSPGPFDIELVDSVTKTTFTKYTSQGTNTDAISVQSMSTMPNEAKSAIDYRTCDTQTEPMEQVNVPMYQFDAPIVVRDVELVPILSFQTVGTTMHSHSETKEVASNTDLKEYSAKLTSTRQTLGTEDKFTSTWVRQFEQGSNTPSVRTQCADTNTMPTEQQDAATSTYITSLDKATYMPSPVIISTGTSTPIVTSGEKGVGTEIVESRDWGSMTLLVKTREQDTCTESRLLENRATNTTGVATKDVAVELFPGHHSNATTNTISMETTDGSTHMPPLPLLTSAATNTEEVIIQEACTETTPVETNDVSLMIQPTTRDASVYKRPHTISRRVGTIDIHTSERATWTERSQLKEKHSMTENPTTECKETSTNGLIRNKSSGTETSPLSTANAYTAMVERNFTDRASSPLSSRCVERGCSPVHMSGDDKGVSATPSTVESSSGTDIVHVANKWCNTRKIEYRDRQSSPKRPFMMDRSSSMPVKTYMDQATVPDIGPMATVSTNTKRTKMVDRAATPIRQQTQDAFVMALAETSTKGTGTRHIITSDSATATPRTCTINSSTEMPHVSYLDKETGTAHIHVMHKNVSTENVNTADKHTSTIDVAAVYKHLVDVPPTPKTFMTRGTCTVQVTTMDREASPLGMELQEKGTSPVRKFMVDKSTLVRQADLKVPVEKFQRPGMGKKSGQDAEGLVFTPLLSAIREDCKESSSDEEASCLRSRLRVHKEQMWGSAPNLRPGSAKESTFSALGSFTSTSIRCKVETGTSTPPIEMEDKAISTESYTVNDKMAECISKLRTVSQRLDTQSNQTDSSGPIYSKANITNNQSVSLPTNAQSTVSGVQSTIRGSAQQAETMVTTVHDRSKSAGDRTDRDVAPFFSPPIQRRLPESAFWSPGLKHKARKQRLDMSQLLRSTSVKEDDEVPLNPTIHSSTSTSSETHLDDPSKDNSKEKIPKRRKQGKKSDKRERKMSGGSSSHSPFSSPERLKERLQKILPAFETPPKKAKERILTPRSRVDRHKGTLDKRAKEQIRDALESKTTTRGSTPPPKKASLVDRVANIGKRLRRTPNSTPEESPTPTRKTFGSKKTTLGFGGAKPKQSALQALLSKSLTQFEEELEDDGDADDDNVSRESII